MKKRADGRYCKQILIGYSPGGKRKMKTIYGQTIKDVEKKERDLRRDIDKGLLPILNDDITVGAWADEWLKTYKSGVSYNTNIRYRNIIDVHIKPRIGDYKLNQVKLATVQRLINDMSDYSASTIKKFKDTMHQMYEAAIINELTLKDPTVGLVLPKKQTEERQPVNEQTVEKIVKFAQLNDIGVFALTLLYTGMRRGEIIALDWKDIDFKNKCIKVSKSVVFHGNKPVVSPTKTKSSNRTVPILDILYCALVEYRKKYIEAYGKNIDDLPVFVNSLGERHTNTSQRKLWLKFIKEFKEYSGMKEEFGMHQLRHTFCTLLYKAGVDLKTTQSILGHSDISITLKIYTHLDQEQKLQSVEKINKFINQRPNLSQSKISQNKKITGLQHFQNVVNPLF